MSDVIEVYENGVLVGTEPAAPMPQEFTNAETLRQQAYTALTTNKTFLALATPTNAQTLAQVKALTKQVNALIRLEVRALDATD